MALREHQRDHYHLLDLINSFLQKPAHWRERNRGDLLEYLSTFQNGGDHDKFMTILFAFLVNDRKIQTERSLSFTEVVAWISNDNVSQQWANNGSQFKIRTLELKLRDADFSFVSKVSPCCHFVKLKLAALVTEYEMFNDNHHPTRRSTM